MWPQVGLDTFHISSVSHYPKDSIESLGAQLEDRKGLAASQPQWVSIASFDPWNREIPEFAPPWLVQCQQANCHKNPQKSQFRSRNRSCRLSSHQHLGRRAACGLCILCGPQLPVWAAVPMPMACWKRKRSLSWTNALASGTCRC